MSEILLPIGIASIAPLAAVIVALITAYKAKKLAYFQVFFERKFDAYSAFWAAASKYERQKSEDARIEVTAALHVIALLSSADIELKALRLVNTLNDTGRIDADLLTDLNDAMRGDLARCRKMKFD